MAQVQYGFAVSLTGILSREAVDAEADGAQGQTRSIGRPGDRRLSQIELDVVEGDEGGEVCLLEAVDERTTFKSDTTSDRIDALVRQREASRHVELKDQRVAWGPGSLGGVMDRFLRYTTQKEPALSASFLAAVLLAIAARYLGLTDEELAILGPVTLILAGVVIRAGVFAPDTVRDLLDPEVRDEP